MPEMYLDAITESSLFKRKDAILAQGKLFVIHLGKIAPTSLAHMEIQS